MDARFFQGLQSFNEEMLQKGLAPSTRVLALEMVSNREDIAATLRLAEDKRLIHLSRLRSADGQPLVVVDTWLPYARFRGLMEEDFEVKSLYALLEQKYNLRVDRATRQFEAAASPRRTPRSWAWMPARRLPRLYPGLCQEPARGALHRAATAATAISSPSNCSAEAEKKGGFRHECIAAGPVL